MLGAGRVWAGKTDRVLLPSGVNIQSRSIIHKYPYVTCVKSGCRAVGGGWCGLVAKYRIKYLYLMNSTDFFLVETWVQF